MDKREEELLKIAKRINKVSVAEQGDVAMFLIVLGLGMAHQDPAVQEWSTTMMVRVLAKKKM